MSRSSAASQALSGESGRDIRRACSAARGQRRHRQQAQVEHQRIPRTQALDRQLRLDALDQARARRRIGRARRRTEHPRRLLARAGARWPARAARSAGCAARVYSGPTPLSSGTPLARVSTLLRGGQRGRFDRQRHAALRRIALAQPRQHALRRRRRAQLLAGARDQIGVGHAPARPPRRWPAGGRGARAGPCALPPSPPAQRSGPNRRPDSCAAQRRRSGCRRTASGRPSAPRSARTARRRRWRRAAARAAWPGAAPGCRAARGDRRPARPRRCCRSGRGRGWRRGGCRARRRSRASDHRPSSNGTIVLNSAPGAAVLAADACGLQARDGGRSPRPARRCCRRTGATPSSSAATVSSALAATTPPCSHARWRCQRRLVPASPASPSTTSRSSRVTKYERPLGRPGGSTRCARPERPRQRTERTVHRRAFLRGAGEVDAAQQRRRRRRLLDSKVMRIISVSASRSTRHCWGKPNSAARRSRSRSSCSRAIRHSCSDFSSATISPDRRASRDAVSASPAPRLARLLGAWHGKRRAGARVERQRGAPHLRALVLVEVGEELREAGQQVALGDHHVDREADAELRVQFARCARASRAPARGACRRRAAAGRWRST